MAICAASPPAVNPTWSSSCTCSQILSGLPVLALGCGSSTSRTIVAFIVFVLHGLQAAVQGPLITTQLRVGCLTSSDATTIAIILHVMLSIIARQKGKSLQCKCAESQSNVS